MTATDPATSVASPPALPDEPPAPGVDTAAYRGAIGLFATGVTVVLAEQEGVVRGMTANAVSSLSLQPTLVIVCPSKRARMSEFLKLGNNFTINILSEEQEPLSNHFAGGRGEGQAPDYEFIAWAAAGKAPRLAGVLSALACRVQQIYEGGDHWIVVGEVLDLYRDPQPRRPLLFFNGKYHSIRRKEPEHLEPSADPWR